MSTTRMSAAATPAVLSAADLHLVNRFSFGASEALIADVRAKGGASKWFAWQLTPSKVTDTAGNAVLGWYPHLADSPQKAWSNNTSGTYGGWQYGFDFQAASLARKVVSRRQVAEVMADFWSNLFYIPSGEDSSFPWRQSFDATIRSHALTSFRSLLQAVVVHPAMSGWLTNYDNTKRGINENLGRELLELFTVGRTGGYTEDDVKSSARLLTGFHVAVGDGYAASYVKADHYVGKVTIMGFTHPNTSSDGRAAVASYLSYLAGHPSTAKHLAQRLCVRFVSDTPSASIVAAVAKAYLASKTDVKATLRALVAHQDFAASRRAKVRTPIEDAVNAARVLGMAPTKPTASNPFASHLVWMVAGLGQQPFSWPRPDGFPETSPTWASPARVLRSWNLHYTLAGNWWGSANVHRTMQATGLPSASHWPRTLAQLTDHQTRMLLGRAATSAEKAAVASGLDTSQSTPFKNAAAVSDWVLLMIRGTVLNSPEGMLR